MNVWKEKFWFPFLNCQTVKKWYGLLTGCHSWVRPGKSLFDWVDIRKCIHSHASAAPDAIAECNKTNHFLCYCGPVFTANYMFKDLSVWEFSRMWISCCTLSTLSAFFIVNSWLRYSAERVVISLLFGDVALFKLLLSSLLLLLLFFYPQYAVSREEKNMLCKEKVSLSNCYYNYLLSQL